MSFWEFSPITSILNRDIILGMSLIWSIIGFYIKGPFIRSCLMIKYKWMWITILGGVFISMFNAFLFWEQDIKITFIAQRFVYTFLLLPALFYIQPSFSDIIRVLKYMSYITLICWILCIISPTLFNISEANIEYIQNSKTDIGYYVAGIHFVLLYVYFLIQEYTKDFTYKKFLIALFWIIFIMLYQNRSTMIGVIIMLIYSFFIIKSNIKPLIISSIAILLFITINHTWDIWYALVEETESQINNDDYNRWKALSYYFNDYSPNIWCYIFGNGMPSGGNSAFGNLLWANMAKGIFASDLGLIGMWTIYGILPLICIYFIIYKFIIHQNKFPLMLKFIGIHILIIPTIFTFSNGAGALFFTLLFYLYAYFNELPMLKKRHNIRYKI